MNAIAYAHYRLRGGMRNILMTGGGYAALVLACIALTLAAVAPKDRPNTRMALLVGLMLIQALIIVVYGFFTVSAAVRLDNNNLMESHRLMPLPDFHAVCGYLIGPTCQALTFFAMNILIGLGLCAATFVRPIDWLLDSAVLFFFALFAWSLTIYWGFIGRNPGRYVIAIGIITIVSGGMVVRLLPVLSVIGSPMIGMTIFSIGRGPGPSWAHAISGAVQIGLSAIFLMAAARRYRHPDSPALNVDFSLMLLTLLVVASAVGIYYWDDFAFWGMRYDPFPPESLLAASLMAMMLVGMLPVANSARAAVQYLHTKRKPIHAHANLICLFSTVAIMLLLVSVSHNRNQKMHAIDQAARTAVVVLTFLLTVGYLLRWTYLAVSRAAVILVLWLVITWLVPLIADVVRYNFVVNSEQVEAPMLGVISTASPLGAILKIWSHDHTPTTAGLGMQVALMALPAGLYFLARGKKIRQLAKRAAAQMLPIESATTASITES